MLEKLDVCVKKNILLPKTDYYFLIKTLIKDDLIDLNVKAKIIKIHE